MKTFAMTCSCGDKMEVQADSLQAAKDELKRKMDQAAIEAHMSEKHPGEPAMSLEQVHAGIDAQLAEITA